MLGGGWYTGMTAFKIEYKILSLQGTYKKAYHNII